MNRGFSTIELMISFSLVALVCAGVLMADFSNTYWVLASQTSSEGLSKAKAELEELQAMSQRDFFSLYSTPLHQDMDSSCAGGGLCYYLESRVKYISACAKYAEVFSSWAVPGYPTTSVSLPTRITYPPELLAQGGDCLLEPPQGSWSSMSLAHTADTPGKPVGVDVFDDTTYLATDASPFLSIYNGGVIPYQNGFALPDAVYGLAVAYDVVHGRRYAFLAMASTTAQLAVVDVTDATSPVLVARMSLAGVSPTGSFPQGFRVAYYDRRVYITTRETAGPELHVVDVREPTLPQELGSFELTTSVYDLVVRDEKVGGAPVRFLYLATTKGAGGKVLVLNVSDPAAIYEFTGAATTLPSDIKSIAIVNKTLFVGTDGNASGAELYALDASDVIGATVGLATRFSGEIGSAVLGLRAAGEMFFVVASTQASPSVSKLLDMGSSAGYVGRNTTKQLRVFTVANNAFTPLSTHTVGVEDLQIYESTH